MPEEKIPIKNYPSNSHKERDITPDKAVEKNIEKVISGTVVQRKKSWTSRIKETFVGDDARSVGSYILMEVLIPAAKTMISDAASQGVERMLFGDARPRSSSSRSSNYTSYNRMYSGAKDNYRDEPRKISQRARATHDFGEVVLDSRGEAEGVLERLIEIVDKYDVATVSDLYDLVGITGSFPDDKWGWGDLRGASVRRVRDGYLLDLPNTMPID
jgi:hypothetical protein